MKKLTSNWLTEGRLDFEYKKYILLAYLKEVNNNFNAQRLYPFMADLVFHYHNLIALKKHKKAVYDQFPEKVKKVDLERFIIEYEKIIQDDAFMEELARIIDFAIPHIKAQLTDGKELYEFVEEHLDIFPVGLVSLYKDEGYLFLRKAGEKRTQVYAYQVTLYEQSDEKYRSLRTRFLSEYVKSLHNTYVSIKQELMNTHQLFDNPATYVIESKLAFPVDETLLPVARRTLIRYLAA